MRCPAYKKPVLELDVLDSLRCQIGVRQNPYGYETSKFRSWILPPSKIIDGISIGGEGVSDLGIGLADDWRQGKVA